MVREHGLWGNLLLNDKNLDIWNKREPTRLLCSRLSQKTLSGGGGGQVVKGRAESFGLCGVWRRSHAA